MIHISFRLDPSCGEGMKIKGKVTMEWGQLEKISKRK